MRVWYFLSECLLVVVLRGRQVQRKRAGRADWSAGDGVGVGDFSDVQSGGRGGGKRAGGGDVRGGVWDGDGCCVVRRGRGVYAAGGERGDDGRREHDRERGELWDEKVRFGLIWGFEWHERDGVRSYVSLACAQSDCGFGYRRWVTVC